MLFQPSGGGGGISSYSQAQRDALTPSTGQVIYNTTSARVEQYDGSIWNPVGWPLNINYIKNGTAETDSTSGWATYADAAQATPENGVGGSPSVTFSTSSTTPLRNQADFNFVKDAANRQGQGVSYDFTIDRADQGRVLQIAFDYEVVSGTYASGDMTVWVYDVTNAVLLSQPSGNSIISTSVPSQQGQCTFQTAINSTSYRLIFHVTTTSASAYTLAFDNVSVGPQNSANGSVDTDWVSFTPTGTWVSNTTYTGKWRRVGDSAEYDILVSTSGAPTSATLTVNLAPGHVIDTTKINGTSTNDALGKTDIRDDSAGNSLIGSVRYSSTTAVQPLAAASTTNNALAVINATAPWTWANLDTVRIHFIVPIVGWGSNAVMSTSANTRIIEFASYRSSDQTGVATNNSDVKVTFNATLNDTAGGFDTTNNRYVVKVPGKYIFTSSISTNGSNMLANTYSLKLYKNGSQIRTGMRTNATASTGITLVFASDAMDLVVDDFIEVYIFGAGNNSSSTITIGGQSGNVIQSCFSGYMLQGPQQIAASESINARYFASATSISGSDATIVWTTKDYDSHNAMSSGTYTIPAPGKYQINCALDIGGTFSVGNTIEISIYKNGVQVSNGFVADGNATLTHLWVALSDIISCTTADAITIKAKSSATSPSIQSSNVRNYFSIARIGN